MVWRFGEEGKGEIGVGQGESHGGLLSLAVLRGLGVLDARFDIALYLGVAMLIGVTALMISALNQTLVSEVVAQLPRAVRDSKIMSYLDRFAAAYRSLGEHAARSRSSAR